MNVQARIVSIKRHTIGYVIGGREYTRLQAVKLARRNQVRGVKVVSTDVGSHLVGRGQSLYALPTRIGLRRPRPSTR